MSFIAAKCPACGGAIQLDDAKESGFCMYCGIKVLLSEAIPQKVRVEGIQTLENRLKNAETFAKLGEIEKAISLLTQITDEYTSDYRAWWLLAKVRYAYGFFYRNQVPDHIDRISASKECRYAISLVDDDQRKMMESELSLFKKAVGLRLKEVTILQEAEQKQEQISKEKIDATLSGNYQYINHTSNDEGGFEVIDGILYKWELVQTIPASILNLKRVDLRFLRIITIDDEKVVLYPKIAFYKWKEMPQELRIYNEKKKDKQLKELKDSRFAAWFLTIFMIGFILFMLSFNQCY